MAATYDFVNCDKLANVSYWCKSIKEFNSSQN